MTPLPTRTAAAILLALLAPFAAVVSGCQVDNHDETSDIETRMSQKSIDQVLADNIDRWLSIPGVHGAGIGECAGEPCIRIYVSRPVEDFEQLIPNELSGHVIELLRSGEFRPLDSTGPPQDS